jgi:3-hydroxybutyryl-CoA dehydrogenase
VIGAGWVGKQVAAKLAVSGLHVGLVDRSSDVAQAAKRWMVHCVDAEDPLNLRSPVKQPSESDPLQNGSAPSNLRTSNASGSNSNRAPSETVEPAWLNLVTTLASFDELTQDALDAWRPQLILECVSEQLSLKKRVLRRISQLASDDCIIASNTSYFVPSVLSKFVTRPERFAQLHFHVPVLRESVADIVGCQQTSADVLQRLVQLANRVGQYPLLLRHEHPGYVFNWLLQAVLKAALELVAQDVVDANDVDRSWKSVTGMSIGPFGLMDQIGLDVIDQVLSNARWAPPNPISDQQLLDIIRPMIEQGRLGLKSGAGFYDYPQG